MENFERRRKKYDELLEEKEDIVKMIIASNTNKENGIRSIRQVLAPQTERELIAGEIIISLIGDLRDLMEATVDERLEETSINENGFLKLYIKSLMAIREGKDVDINLYDTMSPQEAASFLFNFIVIFINKTQEAFDYIYKEIGIDTDNEEEIEKANQWINKTNAIINSINASKTPDDYSDEEIIKTAELAKEFHILCTNNIIIENKEKPKQKGFNK